MILSAQAGRLVARSFGKARSCSAGWPLQRPPQASTNRPKAAALTGGGWSSWSVAGLAGSFLQSRQQPGTPPATNSRAIKQPRGLRAEPLGELRESRVLSRWGARCSNLPGPPDGPCSAEQTQPFQGRTAPKLPLPKDVAGQAVGWSRTPQAPRACFSRCLSCSARWEGGKAADDFLAKAGVCAVSAFFRGGVRRTQSALAGEMGVDPRSDRIPDLWDPPAAPSSHPTFSQPVPGSFTATLSRRRCPCARRRAIHRCWFTGRKLQFRLDQISSSWPSGLRNTSHGGRKCTHVPHGPDRAPH